MSLGKKGIGSHPGYSSRALPAEYTAALGMAPRAINDLAPALLIPTYCLAMGNHISFQMHLPFP